MRTTQSSNRDLTQPFEVDFDEDTQCWCVFQGDFAVATYSDKATAKQEAEALNRQVA